MKKKKKWNFKNYLSMFLVIVTIILIGLIYFVKVLPNEYFFVCSILIGGIDGLLLCLLLKKGNFKNGLGVILSIVSIVVMVLLIISLLHTLNFFKQFGFNSYKEESFLVVVLNEKYNSVKDLEDKLLGYEKVGAEEALKELQKKVSINKKEMDDASEMLNELLKSGVDAILIEETKLNIFKEENAEYNNLKIIDTIKIEKKVEDIGKSVDILKDPFNIYVSGIDTYGSINKVSRSDVNMVISVNPKKKEILLTSIPRDYYVKLPSFNEYDKLTHAGAYGISESIKAIENLLDIDTNYYVKVNFTSLIKVVDALDGIEVNSEYEFVSQDGYSYSLGINNLDGKEALSFARERKSFSGGDRVRIENQQRVLEAIINKCLSIKVITNYNDLLNAINGEFLTNITESEITSFIRKIIDEKSTFEIDKVSLDGTDALDYTHSYKKNKLYVMKPKEESINNAKNRINEVIS